MKYVTLILVFFIGVLSESYSQPSLHFTGRYPDWPATAEPVDEMRVYATFADGEVIKQLMEISQFNPAGYLIQRQQYSTHGELSGLERFEYRADTVLTRQVISPYTSDHHSTLTLKYDRKGRLKRIISRDNGRVSSRIRYRWQSDEEVHIRSKYENSVRKFDTSGRLLSSTGRQINKGAEDRQIDYRYKYTYNGAWTVYKMDQPYKEVQRLSDDVERTINISDEVFTSGFNTRHLFKVEPKDEVLERYARAPDGKPTCLEYYLNDELIYREVYAYR